MSPDVTADATALFDERRAVEPDASVENWAADLPAAWCVYLLADDNGRPVHLLCVRNLRASVRRRLAAPEGPTRRADLRGVVRHVAWTRVDSPFEQDLVYLEAARRCFPESYAGVLGFNAAWFIHVNPETTYPRLTRQNRIDKQTGLYIGPLEDKRDADRLVRAVEDAFDLCRDWERFTGDASDPCQWRQMGKCVGPCEGPPGGVSLEAYRALMALAADTLADPAAAVAGLRVQMADAALARRYEDAAAVKRHADAVALFRDGPFRHARRVEEFRHLAVLPGGTGSAKVFAVTPGNARLVAALPVDADAQTRRGVLGAARDLLAVDEPRPTSHDAYERLSLAATHLFAPKNRPGTWLHAADVADKAFAVALRALAKAAAPAASDDEGEVRALQTLDEVRLADA